MKRLLSLLFAAIILGSGAVATAQVTMTAPIKLKQPKVKLDSFKGTIINSTPVAITVRHYQDANHVRTFAFDAKLVRRMENRHMENGAKVVVKYQHMTDTAVALKGRILK